MYPDTWSNRAIADKIIMKASKDKAKYSVHMHYKLYHKLVQKSRNLEAVCYCSVKVTPSNCSGIMSPYEKTGDIIDEGSEEIAGD